MGTIIYTNEIGFEEFGDMLWGLGRELWNDASDETRQLVWERIEEWVNCLLECKDIPSNVQINDIVSFDCGDLFFPPTFRWKSGSTTGTTEENFKRVFNVEYCSGTQTEIEFE